MHGKLFGDFIGHERTDRYHFMRSIIAHDLKQPSFENEEISIGDRLIHKNAIPEAI